MFSAAEVRVTDGVFESLGMGAIYRGRMTVSEEGGLKRFDIHFNEGPESGAVNRGVYELDGDTWRICLNMSGGPSPPGLESTAANGFALQTLVRQV
jgi:uncharacterized protein (TIGR03067 family)